MKAAGALVLILLLAFTLRLAPVGDNRFLEDEALYAYWGLEVATGVDPMLNQEPVDKPPVFPYVVALSYWITGELESWDAAGRFTAAGLETQARLPSLMASVVCIALVYRLGSVLYGDRMVGLVAALLVAVSPFDISFASTGFTDPMMTALVLGALLAAASGQPGAAGTLAGLAAATKQQGLFFLPLIAAVGMLPRWRFGRRGWGRFAVGFAVVAAGAILWDVSRTQRPGYFEQSLIAYGGLEPVQMAALGERAAAWASQVSLFWGLPFTGFMAILLAGWFVLRWHPTADAERVQPAQIDALLAGFAIAFLTLHWLVGFQVWDRYLLALVPVVALVGARVIDGMLRMISHLHWRRAGRVVASAIAVGLLAPQALLAAQSAWPAGGDHGAYDGIEELARYMRTEAPAGSVLYHYWLGHHYRFYLHGAPLRLHWYPQPQDLAHDATVYRRESRYIAFPSFRDGTAARESMEDAGIRLVPVLETARRDGSVSFVLYRLEGPTIARPDSGLLAFQPSSLPADGLVAWRGAR